MTWDFRKAEAGVRHGPLGVGPPPSAEAGVASKGHGAGVRVEGVRGSKGEVAGWQGNVIDEVERETGRAPYWVRSGQGMGMGDDDWTLWDGDSATCNLSRSRHGFKQQQEAYVRY